MTLAEQLAMDFPNKDLRVLSVDPLRVRCQYNGCRATIYSVGEATYENAKRVAQECIRLVEGHREKSS